MERLIGLLGLTAFIAMAYGLSQNRKRINSHLVIFGVLLQVVFALLALGVPALKLPGPLASLFAAANAAVVHVLDYTISGSQFIFGDLMKTEKVGFIFAFQVLPTIVFVGSLMSVLYHLGVMQRVIHGIAVIMQRFMGTSGAESLSAAGNIFVGQTEAPLLIKPYVKTMTQSELFAVMVGGMATVAGGVLVAYTTLLRQFIPDIAGHLLTASFMSAPASLVLAKILLPEVEEPETLGRVPRESKHKMYSNVIEAAAGGASEGMSLAINVGAMLLAFIALIALCNGLLGGVGEIFGFSSLGYGKLSLQLLLGWVFFPFAWLMGIPWSECLAAGALLGEKTALNEFVAYLHLSEQTANFSQRTGIILSYALCGFANFSSIAIQIGGIGGIAPERRADLARLGIRAIIGGTLACFMTATIAGLLI